MTAFQPDAFQRDAFEMSYYASAQAQAYALGWEPQTGQAQAKINAFNTKNYGQAQARILISPIVRYNLDETSGSLVDSINSANLAIIGSLTYRKDGYKSGSYAVTFASGNYAYNSRLVPILPSGSAARSFSFWVKTSSTAGRMAVFSYGSGVLRQAFTISINHDATNDLGVWTWGDDGYFATSTITNNTWHHVAITYAAGSTEIKIYYDGALLGTKTLGAALNTGQSTFYVGRSIDTLEGLNATLDDFRIYDKELVLSDIQELYSEKPRGYGQAQSEISATRYQHAQALASISYTTYGQAQTEIWRGEIYGQSSAYVNGTYFVTAYTQATIVLLNTPYSKEVQSRSPYAYWSFNQDWHINSTVLDASGNGRHAAIGGTVRLDKPPLVNVNNLYSKAATIYVDDAASGSAQWTGSFQPTVFSVAFWLNPTALGNDYQCILAYNSWNAFVFHSNASGAVYVGTDVATRMVPGTGAGQIPNGTLVVGQKAFYVFTYNAGSGKFYKDGTLIASKSGMTAPTNWGGFTISLNSAANSIRGTVDEVAIFTTELAQADINNLYMAGLGVSFGQAQATILRTGYPQGLSRTKILATYPDEFHNTGGFGQALAEIVGFTYGQAQAMMGYPFYHDPFVIPTESIINISSTYTVTGFDTTNLPLNTYKEAYMKIRFVGPVFAAKFETTGSNYDTILEVLNEDLSYISNNPLNPSYNDDSGEGYTSLIDNLFVINDVTYIVGIYSYWQGQGGLLNLQITPYFSEDYIRFGQAKSSILGIDVSKSGQAQAWISKGWGIGQARAKILTTLVYGQALAYIKIANRRNYGLSFAYINRGQGAGQASVVIDLYRDWPRGQALGWIIREGINVVASSNALIDSPIKVATGLGLALITDIYPTGQALADIKVFDTQQCGQANAWISLLGPISEQILFLDTFTRTTTAPPFNLGSPDVGPEWLWQGSWDSSFSQSTSPLYVNGTELVAPLYNSYETIGSYYKGLTYGEISFDIMVNNGGWIDLRLQDESWRVYIQEYDGTSPTTRYRIVGRELSFYTQPLTVNSWASVKLSINTSDPTNKVRAKVWEKGTTEPDWTTIQWLTYSQNLSSYSRILIDWWGSSASYPDKMDNFQIKIISASVLKYNMSWGTAGALIYATYAQVGQALAVIDQYMASGLAFSHIISTYYGSGFTNAQIGWPYSKVFGLANALITDTYFGGLVINDKATSWYKMDSVSFGYYDKIDSIQWTASTSFNNAVPGIIPPDNLAIQNYYTRSYYITAAPYPISTGQSVWSVEFWIHPFQDSNYFLIWGMYNISTWANIQIRFGAIATYANTLGNHIYVHEAISSTISGQYDAGAYSNSWHHIVLTANGTSKNLYVDGLLRQSWTSDINNPTSSFNYFYINYEFYGGHYASTYSNRDDFAIYNGTELTSDQVFSHYKFILGSVVCPSFGNALGIIAHPNKIYGQAVAQIKSHRFMVQGQARAYLIIGRNTGQAQGLIKPSLEDNIYYRGIINSGAKSFWKLDEDGTSYILDYIGNITGTTGGTLTRQQAGLIPRSNYSFAFNDTGRVDLGDNYDFAGNAPFTWEFWAYPTTVDGTYRRFMSKEDNVRSGYLVLYRSGNGIWIERWVSNGQVIAGYHPVSTNTLYHIAAGYDGTNLFIYVNGTYYSTPDARSMSDRSISLKIGVDSKDNNEGVIGRVDDVAVYDRALTLEEVLDHYMLGLGRMTRWGQAQAYIVYQGSTPNSIQWTRYGQATARILGRAFGQALAHIGPYKVGQALTRISEFEAYPKVVLEDNPYFYHRLWDTSGTIVSNSANKVVPLPTGTYTGSPTLGQTSPLRIPDNYLGKSVYLGDNQYITVGPTTKLQNTFTLEIWARVNNSIEVDAETTSSTTTGTSGERYLWYPNMESGNSGIGVAMGTNVIAVYEHGSAHMPPILVYQSNIGTGWHHVVVVIDRSGGNTNAVKLYLDGIWVRSKDTANRTSISPTVIGYSYGTTNLWLQGSVAEAAIYSTVLSDERILKHFLAGWSTSQFGQAQAHIFGVEVSKIGLAQAQIIIEEKSYRYTVLQDDPILYFPMDETSYWGTKNLVRYPTSGTATYSASSYYSGSYLPDYAADGNYSDGWASSGYSAGNTWWKVTWSTPQTIDTVIITNRPNYTMGSGRIIFSDSTSYNVTFPSNANETATYVVSVSNVTWMQIISDAGGNTNPGFSEVEAYVGGPVNLVRYPTGGGVVTFEASSMYSPAYPPEKAADWANSDGWASNGYSAGLWWKVTWENPQTFQTVRLVARPDSWMGSGYIELSDGTIISDVTFPATLANASAFYKVPANNVTWMKIVSTSGGTSNPGFSDVAVYNLPHATVGTLHSIVGTEHADIASTLTSGAGTPMVFGLESQARSGTSIDLNTVTAYRHGKFSAIPTPVSPTISVITIEAWLYWDGTDNIMPFGFTSYDIYFSGGNVGFNRGAGDLYGVSSTGLSNKWIHFVAVMYHNQNYNVANKIYINGALQTLTQKAGSSGTVSLSKDLHIGGWANDAGYRWTGRIDELAVYNYELTADQVLAHYRAVTDRQYASTRTYIRRAAETPGYWEWTGSGQAQAYLWSYNVSQIALAGSLISRLGEGLVRMIWTGGAYNTSNIQYWGLEETVNQIYYDDGTGPPNYPGSNAGAAWSVRFIADEEGNWWFRTVSDDNSEVFINNTVVVHNYSSDFFSGGHGDWDSSPSYDDPVYLYSGTEYNLHIRWGQGTGPYTIHVYYKRPSDSNWVLLTNNNPPWMTNIAGSRYRAYGRALATIQPFQWGSGQAQAHIKATYYAFGAALAQRGWLRYGTALANIYAFNINGYGLAQAQISWTRYGQAQAHIYTKNINAYGTAGAKLGREVFGMAKAWIRATYQGFGLAAFKTPQPKGTGTGVADIYQTYPLMSFDNIWSESGTATSSITPFYGTPNNVLDRDEYNTFVIIQPEVGETVIGEWIRIDLGTSRTINMYRLLPLSDPVVDIQYSTNGSDWYTAVSGIFLNGSNASGYNPEWTLTGIFTPISARYWRIYCTNITDFNTFAFTTIQLGYATVKNPTFGQALAQLGWNHYGQAQARIIAFDQNGFGTAFGRIIKTYQLTGQSQTWMIPPSQWANALADIYQTYQLTGTANARIIPPTAYGFAQASIYAINVTAKGQSRVAIKAFNIQKYAQAKGIIIKKEGYGQAKAHIFKPRAGNITGLARAVVGIHPYWPTGQAYFWLRRTYHDRLMGQANALIRRSESYARAGALTLHLGYKGYGQAFVVWGMNWGLGQAPSWIFRTSEDTGIARSWIKQTYLVQGQALASIRGRTFGQANAQVIKTFLATALAAFHLGPYKTGQAVARMIAFDVPKLGQAGCYIIVSDAVVVPGPSSNFPTYLVRFGDNDIAGYAQQESYDSLMRVNAYYIAYMDASLSEYVGLENKNISVSMKIWEESYAICKAKVQQTVTVLRHARGFQRLYIGHRDKYYLALAKKVIVSKNVPETSRTLDYSIEFEAKPWLISNEVYTTSGTGTVVVNRDLLEGGWTPATVVVSGTDISITGVGINGQSTGTITISGTHNAYIDTEAFIATDEYGASLGAYINKDFSLYLGPGTTTFTITGATSCTIQWQSRWYL